MLWGHILSSNYTREPLGCMIANGSLAIDDVAEDACNQMIRFFRRNLA